ncbi:MAG: hypothetical protein ACXWU4_13750, partial [Allosphingosinicella sp.]
QHAVTDQDAVVLVEAQAAFWSCHDFIPTNKVVEERRRLDSRKPGSPWGESSPEKSALSNLFLS